ncbi:MAG TPA: diaminopimelate decarboxylase [Bacteroidota bacterium]|nr:diaminopimelate decarboxylase [Bacteroidota bacterium]
MREFGYTGNALYCEETPISEIAAKFGTPLYIYSKGSIRDHCRHIEKGFAGTDHLTCYAAKANANREILRVVAGEGIGADIGSGGELRQALDAGFAPEMITYTGVGKRPDEIEFALKSGVMALNCESEDEISAISRIAVKLDVTAGVLLRVNLDIDPGTHPYITTGQKHNKFGVESSRAAEVLKMARALPGIRTLGVHIHIGSQIINVEAFLKTAHAVTELVKSLRASGIEIQHLNFGGGFGVTYRNFLQHPGLPVDEQSAENDVTVSRFIEAIVPVLSATGCKILIQPGRSIVAHSGILVTEVLYIKRNAGKTFVIVDAGMNDFLRPALYKSYHQIVPVELRGAKTITADVVGPLCESGDFFALDRAIPEVKAGDLLAIMCTGAYGYVLASNYNSRPRPAEVMIEGTGIRLIRQRESIESI